MGDRANTGIAVGCAVAIALLISPTLAFAYVGPGLGMGAFASAFSLLGAVFLGVLGFVWYPVKRVVRALRRAKPSEDG